MIKVMNDNMDADGYEIRKRKTRNGAELWAVYLNGNQATLYSPSLTETYHRLEFLREDDRKRAAAKAA